MAAAELEISAVGQCGPGAAVGSARRNDPVDRSIRLSWFEIDGLSLHRHASCTVGFISDGSMPNPQDTASPPCHQSGAGPRRPSRSACLTSNGHSPPSFSSSRRHHHTRFSQSTKCDRQPVVRHTDGRSVTPSMDLRSRQALPVRGSTLITTISPHPHGQRKSTVRGRPRLMMTMRAAMSPTASRVSAWLLTSATSVYCR